MPEKKSKLHTVMDGAKKSKVSKVNKKDTKTEQKSKAKKCTFAKIKDKKLYQLNMKLAKEYALFIANKDTKDLYSILKLHKFDMEYWKIYILEYKIDNKDKLVALVTNLCKYLYFENKEFLKYIKSRDKKETKDIAKKEFNKAIKK